MKTIMGKRGKTGEHLTGRRGPLANGWRGGRRICRYGYVLLWMPDHSLANRHGYVFEHRLVMMESLGRQLHSNEIVHHINGDKTDNRIENIELLDRATHLKQHMPVLYREGVPHAVKVVNCAGCGKQFKPRRNPRCARSFCSRSCFALHYLHSR